MHHFFAYISRLRHITRWALMRNTSRENVQEHSHQVAVIAHALAVIANTQFGKDIDAGQVAVAALYHDATEILTGDMPTPIKYYNPSIQGAYRQVEEVAKSELVAMLPADFQPIYRSVLDENDATTQRLVKAADKLSAYIKCVEEVKAGNNEFRKAMEQTYQSIQKMDMEEVGYFVEHFLPSFSLTLDELQ
ncbi:5'-deoxynucleotidase [Bengtsoniella intestinalis]|uniref:5'-deoxynucleotidase n=1 Tax=Bengtsoniella intestinalis TaxID=3073143 RepID=UPI00391EF57C